MFIRTKRNPELDRTRIQIVESVRTGIKVRQKILRHKGTPDRYGMPSPSTVDARRILTCVGLTWNEAPFNMPPKRTYKPRRAKR